MSVSIIVHAGLRGYFPRVQIRVRVFLLSFLLQLSDFLSLYAPLSFLGFFPSIFYFHLPLFSCHYLSSLILATLLVFSFPLHTLLFPFLSLSTYPPFRLSLFCFFASFFFSFLSYILHFFICFFSHTFLSFPLHPHPPLHFCATFLSMLFSFILSLCPPLFSSFYLALSVPLASLLLSGIRHSFFYLVVSSSSVLLYDSFFLL